MSHHGTRSAVRVLRAVITSAEAELAAMLDSGAMRLRRSAGMASPTASTHAAALAQVRLGGGIAVARVTSSSR